MAPVGKVESESAATAIARCGRVGRAAPIGSPSQACPSEEYVPDGGSIAPGVYGSGRRLRRGENPLIITIR